MQRITNHTRRERGLAMLTVVVALTALFAAAALAIDAGMVFVARTQAQNVSDAAALAAAYNLIDKTGPTVTLGAAEAAALGVAGVNNAVDNASVNIDPNDIVYGNWDLETETFDTGVDLGDPDMVTAVQVTSYLTDAGPNNPVPAFMARILGLDHFDVSATAIAVRSSAPGPRPPLESTSVGFRSKASRSAAEMSAALSGTVVMRRTSTP